MPRYHFHIHDEKGLLDEEGIDLPNLACAQMEAVRLAGAMLLDDASLIHNQDGWHLSVADANGLPLLRVEVTIVDLTAIH